MSRLSHNIRSAIRQLLNRPGFSLVVIVTLAIGIGLNTAAFSTIDTLFLQPLGGTRDDHALVLLYRTYPGVQFGSSSIPHFRDVQAKSKPVFSDVALTTFVSLSLTADSRPQLIFGAVSSANYFDVMGAKPYRGRLLEPADDSGRGAHPVVVLSYAAWKGIFGGDPNIIGRSIVLDGAPYSVVGVAQPEFKGLFRVAAPALWFPLAQLGQLHPEMVPWYDARDDNSFDLVARMKPGVTVAQARAAMSNLITGLRELYPTDYKNSGINLVPVPGIGIHPSFQSATIGLTSIVMALVGALLLIACVNVANMFLARSSDRAREMAIRTALGAGRSALVMQLVTESLVIALVAGALGVGLAAVVMRFINGISLPINIDFSAGLSLSPNVLLAALGASVVTALVFGLAPALKATDLSPVAALKGTTVKGAARSRLSRGLVVTQMALSLVLLVVAGLFVQNVKAATTVNKGFVSDNVYIATVDPGLQGYTRGRTRDFYQRLGDALNHTPGITSAAFATDVPLSVGESDTWVNIPGYVPSPKENMSIQFNTVTPGYFAVMGIPLLEGRGFTPQDDSTATPVLVINQQFATHFWPGQDPIGKIVRVDSVNRRIVGVVPTGKYNRLGEDPMSYMYFPEEQRWQNSLTIHVRAMAEPDVVVGRIRAAVQALDPNMPVANLRTMNSWLGLTLLPARLVAASLGGFGFIGLLLAAVGIYGVMAYSVAQRTREIGIRMAVGAGTGQVTGQILREGLTLAGVGLGIGLFGAIAAAELVKSQLYSGRAIDPTTFVTVPLVLIGVAVLGVLLPALRASAVSPVRALRME